LKKIAAILLLAILAFNLAGYRLLFSFMENIATARLENKISAGDYSDEQLIEIRIPLNMPYYSDKDYETVYGETDFNGGHYRYVKRKISGNTLYLLCIPNIEKSSIIQIKNEFAKAVNDVPAGKPGSQQKNNLIKLLTAEFRLNEIATVENTLSACTIAFTLRNSVAKNLYTPLTDTQPPEA
jgi:hypothetical protein